MVIGYAVFIGLLGLERIYEMVLSRRNAAWALAQGGVEVGRRHFRVMAVVHGAFLVSCVAEPLLLDRPFVPALAGTMLFLALAAQALRYWAIRTLGGYWNVRVIVVPGRPAVTGGPYRYMRHPNYVAVTIEMFAVPLVHTAWITALVFSGLGALLLSVRIPCEERALRTHCDYAARLGNRHRFLPRSSP